ncbi:MAG: glycoside hydrolase N-terminal domain-containing protein [Caldilineaceae bacterium]
MNQSNTSNFKLWYRQPATQWVEALPLGNGRLGAMVFGGVTDERLQLNEDTLWSGPTAEWNTPGAQAALPGVREAIMAGDYVEADRRAKALQGAFTQSYQLLGDLHSTLPTAIQQPPTLVTWIWIAPWRPPRTQ